MIELNEDQAKRLLDFCGMTDLEFYERYLAQLTLEEQAAFMDEFPEFMECEKAPKDDKEILEGIIKEAIKCI